MIVGLSYLNHNVLFYILSKQAGKNLVKFNSKNKLFRQYFSNFISSVIMSTTKVAVVTGSNKGIGYGIVKGLCEKYNGTVYLTARDVGRGEEAVKKLTELGLKPAFHQLDINDDDSIQKFKDFIVTKHGGIDVLINNAAIAYKNAATEPFSEQAEVTVGVNYFRTARVCEILFPILRENARVIHVSSSAGHLSKIPSPELRTKLSSPSLTISKLNDLMNEFVDSAKRDKNKEEGWGNSAYAVSKVGLSALTIVQQRNFDSEQPKRNIQVNSCHPGYVDTDMTSHQGPLTIEEGAKSSLFLALEQHDLRGKYVWKDAKVVDWTAPSLPEAY